jgi:hypothetical protein
MPMPRRSNDLISFLSILFEEHDVAPCGSTEMPRVVVRISGPNKPVIRHFVPFFAGDFASLDSFSDHVEIGVLE